MDALVHRTRKYLLPAPIIAAFLVTFLADGIGGIKDIWLQLKRWRVNAKWYAFILLSPVVLYVVAILVHITLGGTSPEFPMLRTNQFMIPMTFIYFFLLPWQSTAFLEEVGFRGYALGKLQTKYGPLFGTFILGLFFLGHGYSQNFLMIPLFNMQWVACHFILGL